MARSDKNLYSPIHEEQFGKDVQKMKMSGRKSLLKKFAAVYLLILDQSIESQLRLKNLRDHELAGPYDGFRELHVQDDWLIIYKVEHQRSEIYFVRTGTHADLFK